MTTERLVAIAPQEVTQLEAIIFAVHHLGLAAATWEATPDTAAARVAIGELIDRTFEFPGWRDAAHAFVRTLDASYTSLAPEEEKANVNN